MAKCNLSIEIADADAVFAGGQTVQGTVTVRADSDVNCKGLRVYTAWTTHGFGNVDSGEGQSAVLFQGQWMAGQTYRYDFELQTARWPPTYHGHYLNVDHAVEARADIPWSFDPKASQLIRVVPQDGPEAFETAAPGKPSGLVGIGCSIFGFIFVGVFLLIFILNPFAWALAFIVAIAGGGWWLVFRYMPRVRLGNVQYELTTKRLSPGQDLIGELIVHPKRDVRINGIQWNVSATEICVSGSGSNRKTRTHSIHQASLQPLGETTLPGGQETRIPLRTTLPETPAYSLDLSDNDLKWVADVRIDIPRWPDWREKTDFLVVPDVANADGGTASQKPGTSPQATAGQGRAPVASEPPAVTFAETIGHLWTLRGDEDQTERLISAVEGISFNIEAIIERRLLYGNDDPAAYNDGYVVWAHYPSPEMPLVLFAPHHMADDFEHAGQEVWQGRGQISGYDRRHGRLKIHLETDPPSGTS